MTIRQSTIVCLSSHVASGAVGNRIMVPMLERLGHRVIALPTVMLAWHPGQGVSTRAVTDPGVLWSLLDDLSARAGEIDGVITGYLGDVRQIGPIAGFIDRIRAQNPQSFVLCDPVMGDGERLYVDERVAKGIADLLVPRADIITPNRFELAWLSGQVVEDSAGACAAAGRLQASGVVMTSASGAGPDEIGTLLIEGDTAHLCSHARRDRVPSGTGDLFGAAFAGHCLTGLTWQAALGKATAQVAAAVDDAALRALRDLDPSALAADAGQLPIVRIAG